MTFTEWLETQQERDDPIGDFARDVSADSTAPIGESSYEEWRACLISKDADEDVLRVLKKAWAKYAKVHNT